MTSCPFGRAPVSLGLYAPLPPGATFLAPHWQLALDRKSADGNPNLDERLRCALGSHAESESCAFTHTGRHTEPHLVLRRDLPRTAACDAQLRPDFASSAAPRA